MLSCSSKAKPRPYVYLRGPYFEDSATLNIRIKEIEGAEHPPRYRVLSTSIITVIQSHVADRALVLQPGFRPEAPRWESRVQDTGPPETSWPHLISISKSSPRDLHLNAKTQLHPTTSKLQCRTPYAKQLERREHNTTH